MLQYQRNWWAQSVWPFLKLPEHPGQKWSHTELWRGARLGRNIQNVESMCGMQMFQSGLEDLKSAIDLQDRRREARTRTCAVNKEYPGSLENSFLWRNMCNYQREYSSTLYKRLFISLHTTKHLCSNKTLRTFSSCFCLPTTLWHSSWALMCLLTVATSVRNR